MYTPWTMLKLGSVSNRSDTSSLSTPVMRLSKRPTFFPSMGNDSFAKRKISILRLLPLTYASLSPVYAATRAATASCSAADARSP